MVLENKAIFLTLKKKEKENPLCTLPGDFSFPASILTLSKPLQWLGETEQYLPTVSRMSSHRPCYVFCRPSCTAPRCRRHKLLPHSSSPVFFFPVEVHSIEFTSHSFLQYNLYCRILLHVHADPLNLISPPRNRKKLGGVSRSNQAAKWSFSRQFYQFIFKYSPGYLFSFSTCNKKCPLFFFFTSFLSYTLKFKVAVSL